MKNWKLLVLSTVLVVTPVLGGCSYERTERYVSPKIQGEAQKINLDEVQKAFFESKGSDFNSWMAAFEKRVNEIYDGKEVVSIEASRKTGQLTVTGYIDKVNKEGFQDGDEKLFTLEQTGEAVNNELPYRLSDHQGRPYYEGHRSILDNPFIQMMVFSHLMGGMGGWGGHYYTRQPQVVVLQQHRDSFRTTPAYQQQQDSNRGFFSRFKSKTASGELESRTKFSQPSLSGDSNTTKRRWFGGSSSSSGSEIGSSSGWGGRRSSGFGFSRRGGFGGRRR